MSKIYVIRGKKVMVDRDLAELYGVETRVLNQAVRRNQTRFPEDFMFQMTREELRAWKSQIVISNQEKMGLRKPPLVFTEQGVTMLSCVLNSDRAIQVNIQIIRIFTRLREMLLTHKDLLLKMEELEKKVTGHDEKIQMIFEYLKQLVTEQDTPRKQIGFKTKKK
jgi:phage regulator Rha-like protein